MRSKSSTTLIAFFSVIALIAVTSESFAASSGVRGAFASAHRPGGHLFRHGRRPVAGFVWPGDDGYYYGYGANGEVPVNAVPPAPAARYSETDDIPWDWAHRYPPIVAPSERPYVSSCPSETVTVAGGHTVNIMRCY